MEVDASVFLSTDIAQILQVHLQVTQTPQGFYPPQDISFNLKVSTSSAASTQSTGTLNIGGVTATMTLTTAAAGSSGTGGGSSRDR